MQLLSVVYFLLVLFSSCYYLYACSRNWDSVVKVQWQMFSEYVCKGNIRHSWVQVTFAFAEAACCDVSWRRVTKASILFSCSAPSVVAMTT